MSRIGVSITKDVAYRNSRQEFSNVYYYQNTGALPDNTQALAIIDALTAAEKTWHSLLVSFIKGRLWSQVGTPSQNEMIAQKTLTGVGSQTTFTAFDKERAFLFRFRAGNDSRGNAVYLRKWYHSCGQFDGGAPLNANMLDQASGFSTSDRTAMENKVSSAIITLSAGGGGWEIVAKSGRQRTSQAVAHPFLEHRQLGDQWRAS